ncbi:DUF7483 domain-containing protein [Kiloniella majae]|uniref:DUF7483 domain-containing protein n=1 Tax=Kiloniella majae TaxID=1938558 RepID=UPI000A2783C6|nr:hypothetical protein [Kiloniella majae]
MRALYSGTDGWSNDLEASLALSAGKKLTYTPTVTGNRRQFTIMCNVRRVKHGASQHLFSAGTAAQTKGFQIRFDADDKLAVVDHFSGGMSLGTKQLFRDTEWMFVGVSVDTVARTLKLVVNDQEVDDFASFRIPIANSQLAVNDSTSSMRIGADTNGVANVEANISDFVLLDGEVLTPQEIINYRTQNIPFGNNVITTTKKFTTEGQQERFLALHRNDPASNTTKILDEGKYVERSTSSWDTVHSDVLPSTGKYQIEFGLGADAFNAVVGIGPSENTSPRGGLTTNTFGNFTGITFSGSSLKSFNNASTTIDPPEWGANVTHDMFSMYVDMDARTAILAINGIELPTVHSITSGDVRYYIDLHSLNPGASVNFGQANYKYPKAGYGPLKEPAKSDLKRCKLRPNASGLLTSSPSNEFKSPGNSWYSAVSDFVCPADGRKFYAEVTIDVLGNIMFGASKVTPNVNETYLGHYGDSAGYYWHGSNTGYYHDNISVSADPAVLSATQSGDFVQVAIDPNIGDMWVGRNDVWVGDPAAGTEALYNLGTDGMRFMVSASQTVARSTINFGDRPWQGSPPTGFVGPASVNFDTLRKSGDAVNYEYGPNGTQLLFEDGGNLGKSSAGNLLLWSLTGITSDDQITDTPGDPYAVLNSIDMQGLKITSGGLGVTGTASTSYGGVKATLPLIEIGSYWEVESTSSNTDGFVCIAHVETAPVYSSSIVFGNDVGKDDFYYRTYNGALRRNGGASPAISDLALGVGDHACMAYKDGNLWVGTIKSGIQSWYNGGDPATGANPTETGFTGVLYPAANCTSNNGLVFNFGQQVFEGTIPAGFKELKSSNRETPKYHGRDKFDVNLRTGTGADATILTPFDKTGLSWTKNRNASNEHILQDRLRGAGKELYSSLASAEATRADSVKAFNDGQILIGDRNGVNNNGNNFVDWIFGNDGTEVTNNDGTIPSQVVADSSGYMSILEHIGDGQTTSTVGHGMPDVPDLIISKNLDTAQDWVVHTAVMTTGWIGSDSWLKLHTSSAQVTGTLLGTEPTDKVFQPTNSRNNGNGQRHLHLCFKSVPGLSKVFSYKGNGSNTGPYIDCGFKPRWIIYKRISSTSQWTIHDTERDQFNPTRAILEASTSSAENVLTTLDMDILSDGFKLRTSHQNHNYSGHTYIGLAIADVAGGGNLPAILGN